MPTSTDTHPLFSQVYSSLTRIRIEEDISFTIGFVLHKDAQASAATGSLLQMLRNIEN